MINIASFIRLVIPKQRILPTVESVEQNAIIPQWAMAVIVMGVGSLLFVVIFGVAVVSISRSSGSALSTNVNFLEKVLNRQKRSKKKAPVPLTADMLNELNKNHMGGFDNYGHEELYNADDAWEETRADIKPKVSHTQTIDKPIEC